VGSEVCGALVNGRRGIGVELKPSYYRQSLRNIKAVIHDNGWGDSKAGLLPFEDDMTEEESEEEDMPV